MDQTFLDSLSGWVYFYVVLLSGWANYLLAYSPMPTVPKKVTAQKVPFCRYLRVPGPVLFSIFTLREEQKGIFAFQS